MDHHQIARALLAMFCGLQGAATAVIDLSRTHATHPGWLGHARFHVVWQTANIVLLSLFEIALILVPGPFLTCRFGIAVILAAAPILGFFLALFTRRLYGGTLSDPGGMLPWIVRVLGTQLQIDLNVVTELLALASLAAIAALYRNA